jgi:hypothetical protein
MYKKLAAAVLVFVALSSAHISANAETIEDGRVWLNLNMIGPLPAENWRWYAELQPRWREEGENFDQVLIRPAVLYDFNKQTSAWLGYANVITDPAGRKSFEEHRVWQQILHNFTPMGEVKIQSRTRLEQRFIENSHKTGHKIRQMLRVTVPSGISPRLLLVAYDEYFLNLNDTDYGAERGFDQNRAFVGVNWALDHHMKLEMGYLNQYVNGQRTDQMNHVLSGTLLMNF